MIQTMRRLLYLIFRRKGVSPQLSQQQSQQQSLPSQQVVELKYGQRNFVKMYALVNKLRVLIREEGSPELQEIWDEIESFGLITIWKHNLAHSNTTNQPTKGDSNG